MRPELRNDGEAHQAMVRCIERARRVPTPPRRASFGAIVRLWLWRLTLVVAVLIGGLAWLSAAEQPPREQPECEADEDAPGHCRVETTAAPVQRRST